MQMKTIATTLAILTAVLALGSAHATLREPICDDGDPTVPVCTAIVFSGGGSRGAWEIAAALSIVTEALKNNVTMKWDSVSGVSCGSINAMSSYYTTDEFEWMNETYYRWVEFDQQTVSNICQGSMLDWFFRRAYDIVTHLSDLWSHIQALCDFDPFYTYLENFAKKHGTERKRHVFVTSARLEDGKLIVFDEKTDVDTLIKGVVGSSAVPGLLEAAIIDGNHYVDGGTMNTTNTAAAVHKCMEIYNVSLDCEHLSLECDEPKLKVVLDVFIPGVDLGLWDGTGSTAIDIALRGLDVVASQVSLLNPIIKTLVAYPFAKFRYIISPDSADMAKFPDAFDFRKSPARTFMMDVGTRNGLNGKNITDAITATKFPTSILKQQVADQCYPF